jgi:signal transduction histidine kinase
MRVEISDSVPKSIITDCKRLKQVLFNLVGNALKFTYKGGVSLDVNYQDHAIDVSVEDTGIGIKTEDLCKLFRFFGQVSSTKSINKSGMGLGLTISKMII